MEAHQPDQPPLDPPPPVAPAAGARARVRAELTREIADAGRVELAEVGPAALSLRAVARRTGLAPSALYRYFDSRDHLLAALIIDAYSSLGAVAAAAGRDAGTDPADRWMAIGRALRRWAADHPHEWALVFGSPVPGFVGSDATTAAAMQLHQVAIDLMADMARTGRLEAAGPLPPAVAAAVAPMEAVAPGTAPAVVAAGLAAWSQVLGTISLERFGHFVGAFADADVWFDHALRLAAGEIGLRIPPG